MATKLESKERKRKTSWRKTSFIYLKIPFCGESSAADGADKRFLSGVCALMDLQGAGRREVLPTDVAVVLLRCPTRRSRAEQGSHSWAANGCISRGDVNAEWWVLSFGRVVGLTVTIHLGFYQA